MVGKAREVWYLEVWGQFIVLYIIEELRKIRIRDGLLRCFLKGWGGFYISSSIQKFRNVNFWVFLRFIEFEIEFEFKILRVEFSNLCFNRFFR